MWEKGVPWKLSAVVKVRKLTLSSCYGSERSNTDTGIFINLYTFQQKLQMSARARQRKHEQERPINNNTNICKAHIVSIRAESDGFKAAHVARLDKRFMARRNICQVTGGLQEWLFMVIVSLLLNRRSSSTYICSRYICMPAFHFHSFLLIFINLWPI